MQYKIEGYFYHLCLWFCIHE